MGKFDFEIPQGFLDTLGRMQDVDRIAPKMIDGAIPILEERVKREVGKHRRTGDMVNSIKRTKAGKTRGGGYFATVRPTGKDRKGVRNMEKLAYAEYGTSKQDSTPMLTKATKDSEEEVLNRMQEIFEEEMA